MDEFRIYDTVLADTLGDEPNEQIALTNEEGGIDYIIATKIVKSGDSVAIHGDSQWPTVGEVFYILTWDTKVDLWTVAE